jgi:G3E family GTPase
VGYREPEFLPWDGRRVPITFVGGYLGAGKTTAINELLAHSDRPIAVIINDIGSINIDAALIRKRHGDTIEMTNGCVCCSSIEGMGAAFDQIRARPVPPDHVVVELSGVAEPQRMLPWGSTAGFMLDGVVVVVAADQLLDGGLPKSVEHYVHVQIAFADLLILTKTDLVDEVGRKSARLRLGEIAPDTPVLNRSQVAMPGAVGKLLALGGRRPGGLTDVPNATLFDAHSCRLVPFPNTMSCHELEEWLRELSDGHNGLLVRAKGIAQSSDRGPVLVQIVGSRIEVSALPESEQKSVTDLVVILLNQY